MKSLSQPRLVAVLVALTLPVGIVLCRGRDIPMPGHKQSSALPDGSLNFARLRRAESADQRRFEALLHSRRKWVRVRRTEIRHA